MANINLTYWGLTGVKGTVTVDEAVLVDALITAIATDEGLDTNYYVVSKLDDPSKSSYYYSDSSTTIDTIGITASSVLLCTPNQTGSKEARQIQKLDIAQRKRQGGPADDSSVDVPYYRILNEYDRNSLPTKYVGNDIVDNANPAGLLAGRPWISSGETPQLFSGLAIWYDTAKASTINSGTFVDGDAVATLTNRATNTNAAPTINTRQPTVQNGLGDTLNGYPVIRFATAGTYDNMRFTTDAFDDATGWTVVMLAKTVSTVGFNPALFVLTNSAGGTLTGVRYLSNSQFTFYAPVGTANVVNTVDPDGTWKIITARYDSTAAVANRCTFRWGREAKTVTNGGTPPSGTVSNTVTYAETMSAFDGDFAEQVVYNRALTDAEIIDLEDYLSSKWGV